MNIEEIILRNLQYCEPFCRKVLPFLRDDYFQAAEHKRAYLLIQDYFMNYNTLPKTDILKIELQNLSNISQNEFDKTVQLLDDISTYDQSDDQTWLVNETEKFCKDRALYNAIYESIQIIDNEKGTKQKSIIPELLKDALSISFDLNVGHDYFENSDDRYDSYHRIEEKIPFDLEYFNKITNGGLTKKTLNICLAPSGVGKSLFMCHHAASCLFNNYNVLYITCEMSEERISERIDANLLNLSMSDLHTIPKQLYTQKIDNLKSNVKGKLIVKEYPTATASVLNFRSLLDELNLKKNFTPDIIFIDYLNICTSSRFKNNGSVNSYNYVKAIAEELRGLAIEKNVPIVTATQSNRQGFSNSDIDLTNTSESMGLVMTCDLMFALIATDELDKLNQILVKQLKNRYNDMVTNKRFVIGIDRSKMKLYDISEAAQKSFFSDSEKDDLEDEDISEKHKSKFSKSKYKEKTSEWKI